MDALPQNYGPRTFCASCFFIIHKLQDADTNSSPCPACLINDSWNGRNNLCLACQLAALIHRNRFNSRFQEEVEQWLDHSELKSDSSEDEAEITPLTRCQTSVIPTTEQNIWQRRNQIIESNCREIRAKATQIQTTTVLTDLCNLQKKTLQS
jgi:hypothetical protein